LEWVSASEGAKFAEVTRNFTQAIKNLGPSLLGSSKQNSKEAKHG
jgi:coenzyme F420-reducing hydrogenase delta subunit